MNIFYKVPDKITYFKQVDEYYDNRKYIIMLYKWMGWKDKTNDLFLKNIKIPELRRYYNICDFPEESEFTKNAISHRQEYNSDTNKYYEQYWNYDGNYRILSKFVKPQHSLFNSEKLCAFLKKYQSGKEYYKIMLCQPVRITISIEEAINICAKETNTIIIPAWSFFGFLRYKKYHIYDNCENKYNENKFIGSFYFKENTGQPCTTPLGLGLSFIESPMTHQLTHELVHAVQNCFTVFYRNPKELVELPAMILEKKYSMFSQEFIDKTIALSLADMNSDDPYTFDKIFNEESKSTPPIKVSNRMWHYLNYPRQYYSYALGLIVPYNNILPNRQTEQHFHYYGISNMVRDPAECKKIIDSLLNF